jgi:hypothetical protein
MNKIPGFLFSLLITGLIGCSGNHSNEDVLKDKRNHPLFAFNDFPDSLFYGVYFDQPIEEAKQNLLENGFALIDSSGSFYYRKTTDSTEVILAPPAKIRSLKIILKSTDYLQSKEDLLVLFRARSGSFHTAPEFSVLDFMTKDFSFKLSVFSQKNFIRLNFEKRTSK